MDVFERHVDDAPSRALWASVLLQAVRDVRAAPTIEAQRRADLGDQPYLSIVGAMRSATDCARTWMKSANEDLGSFRWICDLLDLDADRVRARAETAFMPRMGKRMPVDAAGAEA